MVSAAQNYNQSTTCARQALCRTRSRYSNDPSDWQLKPQFNQKYLSPDSIDLFATHLTKKPANFVSWRPDPEAYHLDAFTVNWCDVKGYACPPFGFITKVLMKVMKEQATIMLVVPVWKTQPLWPLLLKMC